MMIGVHSISTRPIDKLAADTKDDLDKMESEPIGGLTDQLSEVLPEETSSVLSNRAKGLFSSVPTLGMLTRIGRHHNHPTKTSRTTEQSRPTLLGIPQELRDMIFSYVYDTFDADNTVLIFVASWRAGMKSEEAPRTKDALLVCKQIYAEQKKMQAAAHRRYWTVQRFLLAEGRHTHGRLQRATKADLQHICRLTVYAYIPRLHNVIISFSLMRQPPGR